MLKIVGLPMLTKTFLKTQILIQTLLEQKCCPCNQLYRLSPFQQANRINGALATAFAPNPDTLNRSLRSPCHVWRCDRMQLRPNKKRKGKEWWDQWGSTSHLFLCMTCLLPSGGSAKKEEFEKADSHSLRSTVLLNSLDNYVVILHLLQIKIFFSPNGSKLLRKRKMKNEAGIIPFN